MIERDPSPIPIRRRRSRTRSRRTLTILGVVFIFLVLSLRGLATFWTDYLWFDSVGFSRVWTTLTFTQVNLVLVAAAAAFVLMLLNLILADRLAPRQSMADGSPDQEIVERFQAWVSRRVLRFRLAVAGFFGLLIGLGAGAWWEHWLLFHNRQSFGTVDPVFGRDVGFYVFQMPFLRDLLGWGFQFFLITLLVVAALHYLNGGIQLQPRRQMIAPGVKVHLSVLLAILALLKAGGYWLDRFDLLYSTRGAVVGATYTDVHAQLPALNLLIGISVVAALALLVNIRLRGMTIPAVVFGVWLVTSIALGTIWPAVVQRFSVQPDEINKELPYVERNIAFTRLGYGLDGVEVRSFAADTELDSAALAENEATIANIRLWDPTVLLTTYRQLQELRPFYQFSDVDVDRYHVDELLTQVMLAARELDGSGIPDAGWVNRHLVFTHGYGAVLSPANTVTPEGQPDFLVKDIDPDDDVPATLVIDQPRIYFGEDFTPSSWVIVGTKEQEVDSPVESAGEETVSYNSYDGLGGINAGSILRRAAFALRFADVNTLISGQVTSDSRVLMVRNLSDMIAKAAPFLHTDSDPYLVVLEGRLVWVQDLYTITDRFPYSTPAGRNDSTAQGRGATSRLPAGRSTLPNDFNYIRNSAKAVIDAYDGTIRFFVIDESDPLIRAYRGMFPDMFESVEAMPAGLTEHLRYPEDLFRVQSDIYTRYHVTDARVFFNNGDPWQIARDPSTTPRAKVTREINGEDVEIFVGMRQEFLDEDRPMVPYYLLMKLPGEEDQTYLALQPFTAATRPNMVSFLVAKSDFDQYGDLIDFELPRDSFIDGPGQVGARINQTPEISQEFTLLDQQGSEVLKGNMLVVPIEESILYVQPIYIAARTTSGESGSSVALPEFKRVVVVFGDRIAMRDTLAQALAAVFGDAPVVDDPDDPDLPDDVTEAVAQLLARADAAFTRAETALRAGDLGTYQEEVEEAQRLVAQAQELLEEALAG